MATTTSKLTEQELLAICSKSQGEYRVGGHPKTSWATTYGDEFIEAAAYLYRAHKLRSSYPQFGMAAAFQEMEIKSCRGAVMTHQRVEYLINTHLISFLMDNEIDPDANVAAR